MLRPFGSAVVFHVAKEICKKGDLRGEEGIMLGYKWDAGTYGYKVWDVKKRRIFITRDVVFDESTFPLKTPTRIPHRSDSLHPDQCGGGMSGWDDEEGEEREVRAVVPSTTLSDQQWPTIDHPSDDPPPTDQQLGIREQQEVTEVEEQPTEEEGGNTEVQDEGQESQHSESETEEEEDEVLQCQLVHHQDSGTPEVVNAQEAPVS